MAVLLEELYLFAYDFTQALVSESACAKAEQSIVQPFLS
jgi:hypothetical protein